VAIALKINKLHPKEDVPDSRRISNKRKVIFQTILKIPSLTQPKTQTGKRLRLLPIWVLSSTIVPSFKGITPYEGS
jgi:hypothetical protein